MPRRFTIAICLTLIFAVPLAADCPTAVNPDDPPCAPNLYYTVLNVEPDWCEYAAGSVIYLQLGEGGATVAWYVIPFYGTTSVPPSGFSVAFWGVVGSDCDITWFIRV